MPLLIQLFLQFLKIGCFAVGGGMATLPFLYDLSKQTNWFTQSQIADMLAISESTPGPIGINMATYVGYVTAGLPGGLVATIGIIIPGILVVLLVTRVLDRFQDNPLVQGAFYGLRPASTALITAAGIQVVSLSLLHLSVWEKTGNLIDLFDGKAILLAVVLLLLTWKCKTTKDLHPMVFLAASAVVGVVFGF